MREKPKLRPERNAADQLFELLKQDHQHVKDLFVEIERDGEKKLRGDLLSQLGKELDMHMQGEERFLYSALRERRRTRQKALAGFEEHHVARSLLNEFGDLTPDHERWNAKLKVLQDIIGRHIRREEQEVFAAAKKILGKNEIEEIAEEIDQQKTQRHRV